ncbi:MAG: hypothetical protein ABIX12_13945 [Rubrivivax sp.]
MFNSAALPFTRFRRSGVPSTLGGAARPGVNPPSLRQAPASRWHQLMFWLLAPAPQDAAPPMNRLGVVRDEFHACVFDLTAVPEAGQLVRSIDAACTLREFWHLRADVYRLVAVQYSQAEAEARLERMNRHFPTRSPRSGFVPL